MGSYRRHSLRHLGWMAILIATTCFEAVTQGTGGGQKSTGKPPAQSEPTIPPAATVAFGEFMLGWKYLITDVSLAACATMGTMTLLRAL